MLQFSDIKVNIVKFIRKLLITYEHSGHVFGQFFIEASQPIPSLLKVNDEFEDFDFVVALHLTTLTIPGNFKKL